jgi:hypothetical protein
LPLDDIDLSATIGATFGPVSSQNRTKYKPKISLLFQKTAALVQKVCDRRSNKSSSLLNNGALSIRVPSNVNDNEPPFPAAIQAATALRLCQLFILYIHANFLPRDAGVILGRGATTGAPSNTSGGSAAVTTATVSHVSSEPAIEGLVDVILDLVADANVNSTYYEV